MMEKKCQLPIPQELELETIRVGPLATNCYILACQKSRQALIIDPGAEPQRIKRLMHSRGYQVKFIINTHGHIDHVGADSAFDLPVYIHKLDADFLRAQKNIFGMSFGYAFRSVEPTRLLEDGDKVALGKIELKIIHTPGHSPGSICLYCQNLLFSGDTLFCSGIGRTDIPFGDGKAIVNSIKKKVFSLPDDTAVFPGHGDFTSIGEEKRSNPFL
jgi:glyoxylase-like metal-dependent hydrolase (beta-lactamase superfamily II)